MKKKAEFWAAHVKAAKLVAMSASEYAKQHGLAVKSLYYWRRKLDLPGKLSRGAENPAKPVSSDQIPGRSIKDAKFHFSASRILVFSASQFR